MATISHTPELRKSSGAQEQVRSPSILIDTNASFANMSYVESPVDVSSTGPKGKDDLSWLTPSQRSKKLLEDARNRTLEATAELSEQASNCSRLLPRFKSSDVLQDIRIQTGSPARRARAITPSEAGPRMKAVVSKPAEPGSKGGSPPRSSSSLSYPQSSVVSIDNAPRRRTPFELANQKRQAGLATMTSIDRAGVEMLYTCGLSDRHKAAARRKYLAEQEKALNKLHEFYENEDHREHVLVSNVQKDVEERVKKWVTIIAFHARAAHMIQRVREARASNVLCSLFQIRFVAHLQRRRARIRRQQQLKERQDVMVQRPTKQQLRKIPSMRTLSDRTLSLLIDAMEKECYIAGEYIVTEGTTGAACYFIHRGAVEYVKRGGKSSGRSGMGTERPTPPVSEESARLATNRSTGSSDPHVPSAASTGRVTSGGDTIPSGILQGEGAVFCEQHLLTEEAHEYSVQAVHDTDLWVLSRTVFQATLDSVDASQAEPVHRMMDERRERNMIVNRTLSEHFVRRSSPLFAQWTDAGVKRIVDVARPSIYRKGDVIVPQGQYGRLIIFIVRGKVEVLSDTKRVALKERTALGEVAAARGVKDRLTSLKANTNCDCWLLQKTDFSELMCHETPLAFLPALMTMVDEQGRERERSRH